MSDESLLKLRNTRENCKLTYGSLAKITARLGGLRDLEQVADVTVIPFGSPGRSREYEPALFRNGFLGSSTSHLVVFDLSCKRMLLVSPI